MTWKEKVEAVKKIPIPEYMKKEVVPLLGSYYGSGEGYFLYRPVEKCPLHNEDTPSFRYYEATNSCACFGCRRGGDVINLHRLVYELNENIEISYKDAVEHLYKVYVEGREDKVNGSSQAKAKKVIKYVDGKPEIKNVEPEEENPIEVMRHNKRVFEAEKRLTASSDEKKYDKFMLLDFIEKLHKLREMSIEDCDKIIEKL